MSTFDASSAFTATNGFVTHMQSQADTAISRLTAGATLWTGSAGSITTLTATSNLAVTAGGSSIAAGLISPTAAAGTKPALLTLTLPTYTAAHFSALVAPTLPSTVSLSGALAPMWNETFWSNLKSELAAFTSAITSSTSVDAAVALLTSEQTQMESALFYRDYERKSQTLRDLYSAADVSTGARGFSYPTSMTTALKLDAQQKYQFDLSETSRTLVTHIFEWAKSNYQFTIQQGISAHNSDTEFNLRYLDTTLKVYTSTVNALIEQYKVNVDAAVAEAGLQLKAFVDQVNVVVETQRALEDIRIKEASFDLSVAKINADATLEWDKTQIADFQARVNSFLETAKENLDAMDRNTKNQIAAAAAAATAAAAMAAGASTITLNTAGQLRFFDLR